MSGKVISLAVFSIFVPLLSARAQETTSRVIPVYAFDIPPTEDASGRRCRAMGYV